MNKKEMEEKKDKREGQSDSSQRQGGEQGVWVATRFPEAREMG